MATATVLDTSKPVLYIDSSLASDSAMLRKALFDLKSVEKALDTVSERTDRRTDALDGPLDSARAALGSTKDALIEAYAIAATAEAYGDDFDAELFETAAA